ncbi:MAG: MgtC/SapB family protein [Blastochloris sp.]|nr:MgtC/SapB family protein [Blastochloris sp.]
MNDEMLQSAQAQALPWELVWRLITAAVLGGAIGLEREWHDHSAGFRTNMLVAVGSCLFTILSIIGFPLQGNAQDSARIAAQIVSGIGFLGAGALFRDKDHVRGMTTAATVWLVAAIGMAAGTGNYFIAVCTTVLALIVLVLLRPIGVRIAPRKQDAQYQREDEQAD